MRRATITTTHGDARAAERVARAVEPDNTAEMETVVDGRTVVTTVARETTGGLRSTVDDYVVNCTVAAQLANQDGDESTGNDEPADSDGVMDEGDGVTDSDDATADTDTTQS